MRIHTHPATGLTIHVGGRKRPAPRAERRYLTRYLAGTKVVLPDASQPFDYTKDASGQGILGLSDILANDRLGDCTSAGAWHLATSVRGMAGDPIVPTPTADDAVKFYSLATGYDPANPASDQGGDEVTVLATWAAKGLDGNGTHAIVASLDVDLSDIPLARQLAKLFGGIYFGVELPDAYLQIAGDGFDWGKGTPNPDNGHCFVALGADDTGWTIDSWGKFGRYDFDASTALGAPDNGGEAFVVLTRERITAATALTCDGIDWATLVADFAAEGGNIANAGPASPVPAQS